MGCEMTDVFLPEIKSRCFNLAFVRQRQPVTWPVPLKETGAVTSAVHPHVGRESVLDQSHGAAS